MFKQRCDHGYFTSFELKGKYNADYVFGMLNSVCRFQLYFRTVLNSKQNGTDSMISMALHGDRHHDFVLESQAHDEDQSQTKVSRCDVAYLTVPPNHPGVNTIDRYAHRIYQVVFKTMALHEAQELLSYVQRLRSGHR